MKICFDCDNFVPVGGGDHICIKRDAPIEVVSRYEPTDAFGWCNRKGKAPAGLQPKASAHGINQV